MATAKDPARNFALISVPGDYAAAEAMKALGSGCTSWCSATTSPPNELAIKTYARASGPDGDGARLRHGDRQRRPARLRQRRAARPIGVVGASGTGMQEVTVRIHKLGAGVSQALGTGGHDLTDEIGGISMLHGLAALDADPPPRSSSSSPSRRRRPWPRRCWPRPKAEHQAGRRHLPRRDPAPITAHGRVRRRATSAQAADMAVALARGRTADRPAPVTPDEASERCGEGSRGRCAPASGTCAGSSPAARSASRRSWSTAAGLTGFSNAPGGGNTPLAEHRQTRENTIIDMGDDEFTQGRPHPMIDPSLRDARIRDEVADPATAVVLFDVVLGYGSAADADRRARSPRRPSGSAGPGPRRRLHRLCLRHRSATRRAGRRWCPGLSPPESWWLRAMPKPRRRGPRAHLAAGGSQRMKTLLAIRERVAAGTAIGISDDHPKIAPCALIISRPTRWNSGK